MNMENFITGYTGHEHQLREKLSEVLGEEKYEYFFDKVSLEPRTFSFPVGLLAACTSLLLLSSLNTSSERRTQSSSRV